MMRHADNIKPAAKRLNKEDSMRGIARFSYRKRRYIVAAWIFALVAVSAYRPRSPASSTPSSSFPGLRARNALDLLEERGADERAGIQGQVVFEAEQGVQDPAVREGIEGLLLSKLLRGGRC